MKSPLHRCAQSLLLLLVTLWLPAVGLAQDPGSKSFWTDFNDQFLKADGERQIVPDLYRAVQLNEDALRNVLFSVPDEADVNLSKADAGDVILSLPLPDGGIGRFRIARSPIMEPALAAKFPEIQTYRGQGIDDPSATVRFDVTPAGFHAMILSSSGAVYIDPYRAGDTRHYISYWAGSLKSGGRQFQCLVDDPDIDRLAPESHGHDRSEAIQERPAAKGAGVTLKTYRLAVAATGEYTTFHGGTVVNGQAAIVTAMNRVNGIYEQETAIRMVLIGNNDLLVYTNANTDPYTNSNGVAMLGENQANIDSVIGSANYDIGHVFSTGGGGVASLRSPCTSNKARGVTGLGSPTGDPFWVDFVAHEMGHQWGGNHSFNGDAGNCAGGNRNPSTAYEPGSGTTIQAYAGICGAQNIQSNSDPFFHGVSLDEIIGYSSTGTGNACAAESATGNASPTADAGAAYTIPQETPFELCGSGTDPNSDPLTFAWEQFDLGPAGAPDSPVGNAPIFRSFSPTASPCRTFPQIGDILSGVPTLGEILPTYARTLNFRLTARDNRSGGGGVGDDATTVTVSDAAGPFVVTSPNASVSWVGGGMETVTWNVANTDQAPVSCASVDISLSTDSGATFPTTLATGVANSGSRTVAVPGVVTADARVQVRCSDNIFFAISPTSFGISVPTVTITSPSDGQAFEEGDVVMFAGTATDPEDGDLSANLVWTSDLDGVLGMGASFQISNLSTGFHGIIASVTDQDLNMATDEVVIDVQPRCDEVVYSAGFETDNDGWIDGASTCTTGTFIRGTPDEVVDGVITQPDGAAVGTFAWFTQNNTGGVGTDDVDGGTCETLSPVFNVDPSRSLVVFLDYFHGQRDGGDDAGDGFSIELINSGNGSTLSDVVSIGDVVNEAVWARQWVENNAGASSVQLRVRATDGTAGGDLIEAGIDSVRVCYRIENLLFFGGFESGDLSAWDASVP